MSCGQILSALKDKWKRFHQRVKLWRWRERSKYFYCSKCCVICPYFDICMIEFRDIQWHPEEYENGEGYFQYVEGEVYPPEDDGWDQISDSEWYGGDLE